MTAARTLTVGIAQYPARYNDVPGALGWLEGVLEPRQGQVDLVLLPEAAFTGYVSPRGDFDLSPFAEPLDGLCARTCAALARKYGIALAVPLIERDGGRCFNSLLLFNRDGERIGHWRKRHPWMPETWAAPGDLGTPLVNLNGVNIAAAICYDLHFLADDAPDVLTRADLLLFPSAWVEEEDSRPARLTELADCFGVAIANANWGASRPRVPGQGHSMILGADGRTVATTPPHSAAAWCQATLTFDPVVDPDAGDTP